MDIISDAYRDDQLDFNEGTLGTLFEILMTIILLVNE